MSALNIQVGGGHYKDLAIQPVEYIHANSIPFIEGCIIKYATRWRSKGGIKDLEKIRHFAELLIELEQSAASRETQQGIGYRSDDVTTEEDEAWDEKRADMIGINGNDGLHYDQAETKLGAHKIDKRGLCVVCGEKWKVGDQITTVCKKEFEDAQVISHKGQS